MAAPAFGTIGTQLQGSGSTMNVPAPASVAIDDILVVMAFIDTAGATVTAAPSGWTQATNSPITGPDNHSMVVYYKRAVSGDTGLSTFDFTLSGSVYRNAACSRYTGAVTSGDPWDVTRGVGSNTSTTTTEDVAITTTVADTLKIWGGTNWSGGTWTPPTSFTERRDTGDGVCTSADLAQASAGGSGTIVGTCTGSDKRCAWVGALKPAGGAAAADAGYVAPRLVLPGLISPDGRVYTPGIRFGDSGGAAAATSAPAGLADGTGSALQPSVALGAPAGAPSGAGTAPQPAAAVRANAGLASAVGSALQPTVKVAPTAGAASAVGSALQPTAQIQVNAGLAAGTGDALQPTVTTTVDARVNQPIVVTPTTQTALLRRRQATTAFVDLGGPVDVTGDVSANAGLASAVGSALQPTVSVSGSTNAPAGLASGAGTALGPAVALGVQAGLASATGSALAPSAKVGPVAGSPTATGTAPQPTVSISGSTNALAGLASAAGSALQPAIAIKVNTAAPIAAGSGLAATIRTGKVAFAAVASAVGSAFTALARTTARPPAAAGLGTAGEPTTTAEVIARLRTLALYSSRQFGADAYRAGENQIVFLPNHLRIGAPLVVVCHGTAAEASWYYGAEERWRPLEAIADTGMVVIAGDLGEPAVPDGWGNDTSVARVDEVITWAASEFGCATSRVSFLGDSAGGATALNWARQNPSQVAGIALRAGVADVDAVYTSNVFLASLIDQAYGGNWNAAKATHDPALNTGELVPIAERIRCYYTSGDDLIPPASTLAFCTDVGCAAVPIGDFPHSDQVHTSIAAGDLTSWLWSLH